MEVNPAGEPIRSPRRDTVEGLQNKSDELRIVSVSDVHGYLDEARSALLTLLDHPDFSPVVIPDEEGRLHWANEDYVLVFNGDLIDRGPANDEVLQLIARLSSEAPSGRIRVTLGNHEAIVLSKDYFEFPSWYSCQVDSDQRQTLLKQILAGEIVAAYRGYNVTYAHAGSANQYDTKTINDLLVTAAEELQEAAETINDSTVQRQVLDRYRRVLGVGDPQLKGRGAGLVWLDFSRLPEDAPPQVVGHTRHDRPRQKGNVFCQNVIRNNLDSQGGETVFVESPESLEALIRQSDGSVKRTLMKDWRS